MDTHSQSHVCSGGHRHTQRYTCSGIHICRSTPRETGKPRDRQTHATQTDRHTQSNRVTCYADRHTPPHIFGSVLPWFLATTRVPALITEAALSRSRRPASSSNAKPFSSPLHPDSPPAPRPAGPRPHPRQAVGAVPGAPVPTACLLSAPGPEDPWKLRKLSEIRNPSSCPAQHPTPSPQALELQHSTQAGSSLTASFLGSNP